MTVWPEGELIDKSHEDSYPDDENEGMFIVRYSVWVRQPKESDDE